MFIAGFAYNGKRKGNRGEKYVNIKFRHYQLYILLTIFKYQIPGLYEKRRQSVELHQDKTRNN